MMRFHALKKRYDARGKSSGRSFLPPIGTANFELLSFYYLLPDFDTKDRGPWMFVQNLMGRSRNQERYEDPSFGRPEYLHQI